MEEENIDNWLTSELFEYLQRALIIPLADNIEDYEREELIKLVKEE